MSGWTRRRIGRVVAAAALLSLLAVFGDGLPAAVLLGLFLLLLPAAVVIHRAVDRSSGERARALGPLVLFSLAFVLILGTRATSLLLGEEGRFFTVDADGTATSSYQTPLEHDVPEVTHTPLVAQSDVPLVNPDVRAVRSPTAYMGRYVYRFTFRVRRPAAYVAVPVPGSYVPFPPVTVDKPLAVSVATRASRAAAGLELEVEARYYADGDFLADAPLTADDGRPAQAPPTTAGWLRLAGRGLPPARATHASALLIARGAQPGKRYAISIDAPVLVVGGSSASDLVALPGESTGWERLSNAYRKALTVALLMLLAVFAGYLLPWGRSLARRAPAVRLADPQDSRRLVVGLVVLGLVGYAIEIASYGGYGGYLDSLNTAGVDALGKAYLRALGTLPSGVAIYLLAWRMTRPAAARRPFGWLERAVIAIGFLLLASYVLKAPMAIAVLTLLLVLYAVWRRASLLLAAGAGALAVLTPLLYLIRGSGRITIGELFTQDYWADLWTDATSRFFQFESLMIATPFSADKGPWAPIVEFVIQPVPRVFWEGKPLTTSAQFTRDYLVPGLHQTTDVGVISLPGETWLMGGAVATVIVGVILGVLLRFVHSLLAASERPDGLLLVAAAVMTWLIFLNDGWGFSSAAVVMLMGSAGWIVFLRGWRSG
jgi:hypothetical protein